MSKTEYVIRVLEAIRQRALVQQLGQIECPGLQWQGDSLDHFDFATESCPTCGAQV